MVNKIDLNKNNTNNSINNKSRILNNQIADLIGEHNNNENNNDGIDNNI
jgi:hypothetical protein